MSSPKKYMVIFVVLQFNKEQEEVTLTMSLTFACFHKLPIASGFLHFIY